MDDPVAKLLTNTAATLRREWEDFVGVAYILLPEAVDDAAAAIARASKVGVESIRRRLYGVQKAKSLGYSKEEIIGMGQEKILSMAQEKKREERYTETVTMLFRIPGSQREIVQQQIKRVQRVLKMKTHEEFWDWWLGQMVHTTDAEILHSGGEASRPKTDPDPLPPKHQL